MLEELFQKWRMVAKIVELSGGVMQPLENMPTHTRSLSGGRTSEGWNLAKGGALPDF